MWVRVSRSFPCPVCGRPDWCSLSEDGEVVKCMRVPSDFSKVDASGSTYYIHRQGDSPVPIPGEFRRSDRGDERRAPVEVRAKVYEALFRRLRLRQDHRDDLRRRGLSEEEIGRRGYKSWPSFQERRRLCEDLAGTLGVDLTTIPGFFVNRFDSLSLGGGPSCYGIPCRDKEGRIIAVQLRNDDSGPEAGPKYIFLSSLRHGGPSPGYLTHIPLYDGDVAECRVTEGLLKADVATSLLGTPVLAMTNCSSFQGLRTLLPELKVRRLILAMDADHRTNRHVLLGMANTALQLRVVVEEVAIEVWDPALGKGLDDVAKAEGARQLLEGREAWQWLRRLCLGFRGLIMPPDLNEMALSDGK